MTGAALRRYCLAKPGAVAEYPFGPGARVYKVAGKMFALIPDETPLSISLKCDPALAEILREQFPAVRPGYHFNKRHWNTVAVDGSMLDRLVREWIDHSYDLVVSALPRTIREGLAGPTASGEASGSPSGGPTASGEASGSRFARPVQGKAQARGAN